LRGVEDNIDALCTFVWVYLHIWLWLVYTNIDLTLMNSLHKLLNYEIAGLERHFITTEYSTRVLCIHMHHLFYNALVYVSFRSIFIYNTTIYCSKI